MTRKYLRGLTSAASLAAELLFAAHTGGLPEPGRSHAGHRQAVGVEGGAVRANVAEVR